MREALILTKTALNGGKIIQFSGRPRHLSTILLKNSYLFKIIESVINFYFKFFFNSAILNMWEF